MTQNQAFIPKVDEPSDNLSPLIRFKGILKEYKAEVIQPDVTKGQTRQTTRVTFNFTDVVVIESREPYPFPIATIPMPYSERADTRWAAWTKSFRELVPVEARGDNPLDVLVGREQEWFFKPAKLRLPKMDDEGNPVLDADGKQVWGVQLKDTWQIVSIQGFTNGSGPGLIDVLIDYADGKKDQEIYQWVFTNQDLKNLAGYTDAVSGVADRVLLKTLVEAGKLTEDADGVYHKA